MEEPIQFPSWKHAVSVLRERGITYGTQWTAAELEELFREKAGSEAFNFGFLALKQEIERKEGYYIRQIEGGKLFIVVDAEGHEDVAQTFDEKVRRYAVRSINLRSATLMNPEAALSTDARRKMESGLEKAAIRLALMSRQTPLSDVPEARKFLRVKKPKSLPPE